MTPDLDLDLVAEQEYSDIIADVVGHSEGEPTIAELDELNPGIDRDVIRDRIYRLANEGILEPTLRAGYRLTPEARETFDENDLFPREAWKRQQDRVEGDSG